MVYFSEADFFDPSGTGCTPLEAPASPSDDISASDPALSSLSASAAFFAALGLAGGFLAVCFVAAFAPSFFTFSEKIGERAYPKLSRH